MKKTKDSKLVLSEKKQAHLKSSDCPDHGIGFEEGAAVIQKVLDKIGGKWKVLIIFHLAMTQVCRFGELKRKIPVVSQRMLTLVLREMESDGLIIRKVYAQVPPKVEYSLTEEGASLKDVYSAVFNWGKNNLHIIEKKVEKEQA